MSPSQGQWKSAVPAAEITGRQHALQRALQIAGIEAALVIQRVDLYYLTGTAQSAFLFVPAQGRPLLCVRRYLPRALAETPPGSAVRAVVSVKDLPGAIREHQGHLPKVLGLELDVLPVNDYRFYRGLFADCRFEDVSGLILDLRAVKSDWELARLDAAAGITARVFEQLPRLAAAGMSEMELAGRIETCGRRLGLGGQLRTRHFLAEGYPFHVLSGASGGLPGVLDAPASGEGTSAAFPCGAGGRKLVVGDPVMVDMGSVLDGYHLDETRMLAVGRMPAEAEAATRAAIAIHDALIDRMRPGVPTGELFAMAVELAARQGHGATFLGPPDARVRFVGHGIGLEIVEPPFVAAGRGEPLQAGMVLAIEPKLVFAGRFIAGVESVVAVTADGTRLISRVPVETIRV